MSVRPHQRYASQVVNPGWVKALAWSVALIIAALNAWRLYQTAVTLVAG